MPMWRTKSHGDLPSSIVEPAATASSGKGPLASSSADFVVLSGNRIRGMTSRTLRYSTGIGVAVVILTLMLGKSWDVKLAGRLFAIRWDGLMG